MTKLALALLLAVAAAGPTTSFAFGNANMRGGGGHGGGHGSFAVQPFHEFHGFPMHHGFHGRSAFFGARFVGPVFYGYPAVVYVSGQPATLYCQAPAGYFPYIQYCPTGWLQLVP